MAARSTRPGDIAGAGQVLGECGQIEDHPLTLAI